MLRTADYEKILDFLSMIQENNKHFSDQVIYALESVFNFHHTAFFVSENSMRYPIAHNLQKNVIEDYSSYFHKLDIFNEPYLQRRKVISIDDVMPYNEYLNTEYYNSFQRKYGFSYTVTVPIKLEGNIVGGIGIHRTKEEGDFSLSEKLMLANASKFISAGFDQSLKQDRLHFFNKTFVHSIELLPGGFILLDQNFLPLYYNSLAKEYCLDTKYGSLKDPVKAAVDFIRSRLSMPMIKTGESEKIEGYGFKISPIYVPLLTGNQYETMYCIYVDQEKEPFERMLQKAKGQYGLSKRETEIVSLIAVGYSNNEMAETLFLSINTIKSHLNNIFNKLHVNNRTAIVHKINNIM
ncbi:response regulator transcription factor [Peribacillus frigoritolerans]|uniref:response regulator transcription factor n=1 Tax=Peribacillus frigoritolerans TaxID=450367 RepID=UPI003D29047E